jgi:2'-5' RNA ligase
MRTLPDHLRAFVAIRLSLATETAIAHYIENAREQGAGVAWVRSPNLHMTLRFLGGGAGGYARVA